jgi:hydrogenase nickel incorporation protein HypA/HybF
MHPLTLLYFTMHEFSICEGIVSNVAEELAKIDKKPFRLLTTRIVVGEMHQIVTDTLAFAYEVLTRDTIMKGSTLDISVEPVRCRCNECSWEGKIEQPMFLCGQCNSGNVEILNGKELYVESLEVEVSE